MRVKTLPGSIFRYRGTRSGDMRRWWIRLKLNIHRYAQLGTSTTSISGLLGAVSALLGLCAFGGRLLGKGVNRVREALQPLDERFFERSHTAARQVQGRVYRLLHKLSEALHAQSLRPRERTLPLLALTTATVLIFSLLFFGLGIEVQLDGQTIGYLNSATQLKQAVSFSSVRM